MEEKEYNVVTLDDGVEYAEVHRLDTDGNTYVFLASLNDSKDFCIKKLIKEDGKNFIIGLDNEEEFNKIFKLFSEKYTN